MYPVFDPSPIIEEEVIPRFGPPCNYNSSPENKIDRMVIINDSKILVVKLSMSLEAKHTQLIQILLRWLIDLRKSLTKWELDMEKQTTIFNEKYQNLIDWWITRLFFLSFQEQVQHLIPR